ncbi:hypothetical protein VTK26DRAFT_2260 [Humicola hyalothermophila]
MTLCIQQSGQGDCCVEAVSESLWLETPSGEQPQSGLTRKTLRNGKDEYITLWKSREVSGIGTLQKVRLNAARQ